MSDVLDRLHARARGTGLVLHPRRQFRFGPTDGGLLPTAPRIPQLVASEAGVGPEPAGVPPSPAAPSVTDVPSAVTGESPATCPDSPSPPRRRFRAEAVAAPRAVLRANSTESPIERPAADTPGITGAEIGEPDIRPPAAQNPSVQEPAVRVPAARDAATDEPHPPIVPPAFPPAAQPAPETPAIRTKPESHSALSATPAALPHDAPSAVPDDGVPERSPLPAPEMVIPVVPARHVTDPTPATKAPAGTPPIRVADQRRSGLETGTNETGTPTRPVPTALPAPAAGTGARTGQTEPAPMPPFQRSAPARALDDEASAPPWLPDLPIATEAPERRSGIPAQPPQPSVPDPVTTPPVRKAAKPQPKAREIRSTVVRSRPLRARATRPVPAQDHPPEPRPATTNAAPASQARPSAAWTAQASAEPPTESTASTRPVEPPLSSRPEQRPAAAAPAKPSEIRPAPTEPKGTKPRGADPRGAENAASLAGKPPPRSHNPAEAVVRPNDSALPPARPLPPASPVSRRQQTGAPAPPSPKPPSPKPPSPEPAASPPRVDGAEAHGRENAQPFAAASPPRPAPQPAPGPAPGPAPATADEGGRFPAAEPARGQPSARTNHAPAGSPGGQTAKPPPSPFEASPFEEGASEPRRGAADLRIDIGRINVTLPNPPRVVARHRPAAPPLSLKPRRGSDP